MELALVVYRWRTCCVVCRCEVELIKTRNSLLGLVLLVEWSMLCVVVCSGLVISVSSYGEVKLINTRNS